MNPAASPLLHADGLRCERAGRVLLDGFSLALQPGESIWLRGANGSGKTTLLRTLAGLREPAAGRVQRGASARLCHLGHANALKDELSLQENLGFAARLQNLPAAAVRPALARFGLQGLERRAARRLSQGQRRRAALASLALAPCSGGAWLLDEPFDALDDAGVAQLVALLHEHLDAGGALLFTSHQAVPALRLSGECRL